MLNKSLDNRTAPFHKYLHLAVREISALASQSKCLTEILREIPKTHSLYHAPDKNFRGYFSFFFQNLLFFQNLKGQINRFLGIPCGQNRSIDFPGLQTDHFFFIDQRMGHL